MGMGTGTGMGESEPQTSALRRRVLDYARRQASESRAGAGEGSLSGAAAGRSPSFDIVRNVPDEVLHQNPIHKEELQDYRQDR